MNEELSAADRQTPDLKSPAQSAFSKLFAVGVFGWLIGALIVFGLSWPLSDPESVPSAVIWTITHCWAAFLTGLVVLVGYGIVKGLPVGRAAFAFLLPVVLLVALSGLCLLVYPDNVLREDLFSYLPVVFVFYVFGLLWMWLGKDVPDSSSMARAIIPAVVGGCVIWGFVVIPVFASDAFKYRDAFQLAVGKTTIRDGAIVVEGSIGIRKPGNYQFSAPRYVWAGMADLDETEPQIELGAITWGPAGAPKAGDMGVYPLQIVWRKGVPPGGVGSLEPYEDLVSIEVRSPDQGDKVIYSMSQPMLGR